MEPVRLGSVLCRVGCVREFGRRQTHSSITSEQEHITTRSVRCIVDAAQAYLSSERSDIPGSVERALFRPRTMVTGSAHGLQ